MKLKASVETKTVDIQDFDVFRQAMVDLLENEIDPKIKNSIILKVVEKIIVKGIDVEIYFYVGEKHYKRELLLTSSQGHELSPKPPENRYTNPLPVFHGNPEDSVSIDFKPKKIYDAGSKSFEIGRLNWTRTSDLSHVKGTRYQLRHETILGNLEDQEISRQGPNLKP